MHAERALHSNPCLVSSISHVFVLGVQIRTIGQQVAILEERVRNLENTGEGDCICTRDEDGDLEIDDECPVRGHSNYVTSVAYSPDGKHIVSGSWDKTVKIWDSTTGKEVSVLVCHRPTVCCCVERADLRVLVHEQECTLSVHLILRECFPRSDLSNDSKRVGNSLFCRCGRRPVIMVETAAFARWINMESP